MVLPYWNEIDLSQTHYNDGWTSKKLEADPRYTERLKIFDRWCRRWIEYYRRKEINAVIDEANEREKQRREQTQLELREHLDKTFGNELPDSAEKLRNATFREVKKPAFNADFNAEWIDDELKRDGLYMPELEIVKSWLQLVAVELAQPNCEKIRERIRKEEAFSLAEATDEQILL
ncbi:MAG: hypothetical protein HFE75_16705 [Firmicutes bacterium]|nr:hypothetical protein [Bacillota bacterium]NBI64954.1 hypothetical protein [Clostridiales bacterium]